MSEFGAPGRRRRSIIQTRDRTLKFAAKDSLNGAADDLDTVVEAAVTAFDIFRATADFGSVYNAQSSTRRGAAFVSEAVGYLALPKKLLPGFDAVVDSIAMPVFFGGAGAVEGIDQTEQRSLVPALECPADQIEKGFLVRPYCVVSFDAIGEQMNAQGGSSKLAFVDGGFEMIKGEFQIAGRREQRAAPRFKIPLAQLGEQPAAQEGARRVADQMNFQTIPRVFL